MKPEAKTALFVLVATIALALGFWTRPSIEAPELYDDTGELFFPDFTDPDQATALEVVEFNADTGEIHPFRVERKDGRWVIPSHHGYPADAKEKMAKAATLVIGLKKEAVRSDSAADHALYGVVDPTDESVDTKGRGTLVKFEDSAGNVLASLIVGKQIEGRSGMRYVRIPGKKRVYVTKLEELPSTKFADWIDTELLDVSSFDLNELTFNNYSVDERTGTIVPGDVLRARKVDYKWKLEGLDEEKEETDEDRLREVADELAGLKIVGVRPKPAGLSRDLSLAEGIQLTPETLLSLQARGFYVTRDHGIASNEGELVAKTKGGLVYVLRFGEVIYGQGEALTAGSEEEAKKKEDGDANGDEEAEQDEGLKANRFVMITCSFDEGLLDAPEGERPQKEEVEKRKKAREQIEDVTAAVDKYKEKHDGELPETLEALTEGDDPPLKELPKDPWGNDLVYEKTEDGFVLISHAADGKEGGEGPGRDVRSDDWKYEDDLQDLAKKFEDYDKKVEEGRKKATRLSERFAPWYYVVSEESFEKLHPKRDELVKPKEKEEEEETDEEAGEKKSGDESAADDGAPEAGAESDASEPTETGGGGATPKPQQPADEGGAGGGGGG